MHLITLKIETHADGSVGVTFHSKTDNPTVMENNLREVLYQKINEVFAPGARGFVEWRKDPDSDGNESGATPTTSRQ